MRRGDVGPRSYPDRFLSNDFYKKVLTQITTKIPEANIYIFSEGNESDFKEFFSLPNLNFQLGTNVFETFHAMCAADIFVTGVGSFSILAAHLSNGIIVTKPWNIYWRNFPEHYHEIIPINNNGNISIDLLTRAMKLKGVCSEILHD
jgi:hypothetical protein